MRDQLKYLHNHVPFPAPIPVYGGSDNVLKAVGSRTVILLANKETHNFHSVWNVPNLGATIISKHWTKPNDLRTTLDDDEKNIILMSKRNPKFRVGHNG